MKIAALIGLLSLPGSGGVSLAMAGVNESASSASASFVPGQQFTIAFPDMPQPFDAISAGKRSTATMHIFLPQNYDAQRKHPLLIFLGGGNGGAAGGMNIARKLADERDFVCVGLPYFKAQVETNATGKIGLALYPEDFEIMWPLLRTMLAKLDAKVPNIDPAHRILGGFSNGGHTTAGLLDYSEGEVSKIFAAFFCIEGGGRLQHYELLKGKPFLMLFGSAKARNRVQQIFDTAQTAGAQVTLHEMKGAGHNFPEREYPFVRAWLREAANIH